MHVKRKGLKRLAIAVAVIATMATGLTANALAQGGSLTGAGSTLVAQLMNRWTTDFQSRYGISVTYGGGGSTAGVNQIVGNTVDFGASDAPLSAFSVASSCTDCVQIPWGLSAAGISFHLDGVQSLKLSGPVLAKIYLGQITMWNDQQIQRLNKGVRMPAVRIIPVWRTDGSGTTYAFTDFMTHVSGAFRKGIGGPATAVSWPVGTGGRGSDGVTAVVSGNNGAIGYVETSYILTHGLNAAALQNRAGKFVYPNLSNIAAAASELKRVPRNNEVHIIDPPKKYKKAYPDATFTYAIVHNRSPKKSLLASFMYYAITTGQGFGPALDFAHLPKVVQKAATNSIKHFQQG